MPAGEELFMVWWGSSMEGGHREEWKKGSSQKQQHLISDALLHSEDFSWGWEWGCVSLEYMEEFSKGSLLVRFLLLCNEVVSHSALCLIPSNLAPTYLCTDRLLDILASSTNICCTYCVPALMLTVKVDNSDQLLPKRSSQSRNRDNSFVYMCA